MTGDLHRPEEGQRRKPILNEIGKGIVILFIVIAAFKFITWNFPKLEQAAAVTTRIVKAPPAVNLIISKGKTALFRKSFPYNPGGNYYIVNRFDISPYIEEPAGTGRNSLEFTVNGQRIHSFLLFRFTRFNILYSGNHSFVFTTRDSGIEDLVRLRKRMPFIRASLLKLALGKEKDRGENITGDSTIVLKYGDGIFSLPISAHRKGEILEVVFDYNVTGRVQPVLLLSAGPGGEVFFRRGLSTSKKGISRKVGFLFRTPENMASPVFHLAARYRGNRQPVNGEVHAGNISIHRYRSEDEFQGAAPLIGSLAPAITYFDALKKIDSEFIQCIHSPGTASR